MDSFDSSTIASIAACAVAAVALLIAGAQVLQQYISSGSLIRLCDSYVFGPMPGGGKRIWSSRQFRFRVVYKIPQIRLPPEWFPSPPEPRVKTHVLPAFYRFWPAPAPLSGSTRLKFAIDIHRPETFLKRVRAKGAPANSYYISTKARGIIGQLRHLLRRRLDFDSVERIIGVQVMPDSQESTTSLTMGSRLVALVKLSSRPRDLIRRMQRLLNGRPQRLPRLHIHLPDKSIFPIPAADRFGREFYKYGVYADVDELPIDQHAGEACWAALARMAQLKCEYRLEYIMASGDADRCPTDIQVVPMLVSLRDILVLCFMFGMEIVTLDLARSVVQMVGKCGVLMSSSHPLLGMVLRFVPQEFVPRGANPVFEMAYSPHGLYMQMWIARLSSAVAIGSSVYNSSDLAELEKEYYEKDGHALIRMGGIRQQKFGRRPPSPYMADSAGPPPQDEPSLTPADNDRHKARQGLAGSLEGPSYQFIHVPQRSLDDGDQPGRDQSLGEDGYQETGPDFDIGSSDMSSDDEVPYFRTSNDDKESIKDRRSNKDRSSRRERRSGLEHGQDLPTSPIHGAEEGHSSDRSAARRRRQTRARASLRGRPERRYFFPYGEPYDGLPETLSWYWLSQQNIMPGYWATNCSETASYADSFLARAAAYFREAIKLKLQDFPEGLQFLSRGSDIYHQALGYMKAGFMTYPPFAYSPRSLPRQSWLDSDLVQFPQNIFHASMMPIFLPQYNEHYISRPGGLEIDMNDQDLCELLLLDSWMWSACEQPEIAHGGAQLRSNTPAVIETILGREGPDIEKMRWMGPEDGFQELHEQARWHTKAMSQTFGLTDAEHLFLLVALYRTVRTGHCTLAGPDASDMKRIMRDDRVVYLV